MPSAIRFALAALLALAALAGALAYPFAQWQLVLALLVYGAALWRWPLLWLVVMPAVLPNLDLSPWTGWLLVQESDFFVLVTLAVLTLRAPLRPDGVRLRGLPGAVLAFFLVTSALSISIGLLLPDVVRGSAIVYLTQANTLRVAKPLVFALALWLFLRARERDHGDGWALFGAGTLLGLASVVGLELLERAVFVSILDFSSDYRVAAGFASMHVGGGHIGAWLAMALPFLAVPLLRRRIWSWPVSALLGFAAAYGLAVTFARTAYAAGLVGLTATASGLGMAAFGRTRQVLRGLLAPAVLLLGVAVAVVIASGSAFMVARFAGARADFSVREANWLHGLEVRDYGPRAMLLGSGLGTFPRLWFDRAASLSGPSNIRLDEEEGRHFVTLVGRQPLFFVQKTPAVPGQTLRVELRLRGHAAGAGISAGLCQKWLLYSLDCASATHRAVAAGVWEDAVMLMTVPTAPDGRDLPIELYFSVGPGQQVDIADVRLRTADGTGLLRNGDFAQGTTYWFFTDDHHVLWRIFNQYLTAFFEGGLLGVVALVMLLAGGIAGSLRGLARGELLAACPMGALAAFAVSALFDAPLEAPRVALIFYLIAFGAIAGGEGARVAAEEGRQ